MKSKLLTIILILCCSATLMSQSRVDTLGTEIFTKDITDTVVSPQNLEINEIISVADDDLIEDADQEDTSDNAGFEVSDNTQKSIVYFMRRSSDALLIKFDIFDADKKIETLSFGKYIRYECDPGEHLFLAKSEVTDIMEANLEAGKIYVVDVEVHPGILFARAKLVPFSENTKNAQQKKEKILKFISKTKKALYVEEKSRSAEQKEAAYDKYKTLRKYKKNKAKNKKFTQLFEAVTLD